MGDEVRVQVGQWYKNAAGDDVFIFAGYPFDSLKFVGVNRRLGHVNIWFHDGRGCAGHPSLIPSDLVEQTAWRDRLEDSASLSEQAKIDTILFDFEHCVMPKEFRKERVDLLRNHIAAYQKAATLLPPPPSPFKKDGISVRQFVEGLPIATDSVAGAAHES